MDTDLSQPLPTDRLKQKARCIIRDLKKVNLFKANASSVKIAIFGSLALNHRLEHHTRIPAGVDILIDIGSAEGDPRSALFQAEPRLPFCQAAQSLFYGGHDDEDGGEGKGRVLTSMRLMATGPVSKIFPQHMAAELHAPRFVQNLISMNFQFPFASKCMQPLAEIDPDGPTLPYVDLAELLLFKVLACGLRWDALAGSTARFMSTGDTSRRDAHNIIEIIEAMPSETVEIEVTDAEDLMACGIPAALELLRLPIPNRRHILAHVMPLSKKQTPPAPPGQSSRGGQRPKTILAICPDRWARLFQVRRGAQQDR